MSKRHHRERPRRALALLASGLLLGAEASAFEIIGLFADEGGEPVESVTEVQLENGDVIRIVYSQGAFAYLTEGSGSEASEAYQRTLVSLSNPQLSEFFIPGLFGYTASGGPEVEQRELVVRTNLTEGVPTVDSKTAAASRQSSATESAGQSSADLITQMPTQATVTGLFPAQVTPPSYSEGFQLRVSPR